MFEYLLLSLGPLCENCKDKEEEEEKKKRK